MKDNYYYIIGIGYNVIVVKVASVIVPAEGGTGRADNILVPSGGRNLNCDFGFVLVTPGRYPASMQHLPTKDWSPVVDVVPQR